MKEDEQRRAALAAVVREAKGDLVARPLDWDRVGASLDARLDAGARATASRFPGRTRAGLVGLAAVAAAAAFAIFAPPRAHPVATVREAPAPLAFVVRGTPNGGEVLVGGRPVGGGAPVRQGEEVEVRSASATFEQEGRAAWRLEPGTRARAGAAGEALLLALDSGAVEADVTKSTLPESFVVEVSDGEHAARVAVHGTHLRVAREGRHVVVDLSEGVVVVGPAPKGGGITEGVTLHAPAHAELDVADVEHTTRVTDGSPNVRAPVAVTTTVHPGHVPAPSRAGSSAPRPVAPSHPTTASVDVVAHAVESCARASEHPGSARVMVTSTLHLDVGDDGMVKSARFDPPLAPAVQTCAADAIYRTRLERTGEVDVSIAFSY